MESAELEGPRKLLRIWPEIFEFEPHVGLKRSQTKPKIPGTVPPDRDTTIPNDYGPISACFDDDPKIFNCEIAQPSEGGGCLEDATLPQASCLEKAASSRPRCLEEATLHTGCCLQYTVCNTQFAMHSTVCGIQYTLRYAICRCNIQYVRNNTQYMLVSIQHAECIRYTVFSVQYTVCSIQCAIYNMQSLYTIYSIRKHFIYRIQYAVNRIQYAMRCSTS